VSDNHTIPVARGKASNWLGFETVLIALAPFLLAFAGRTSAAIVGTAGSPLTGSSAHTEALIDRRLSAIVGITTR
jgi:hypothetical protein